MDESQRFIINIISITISVLIVRIIYTVFDNMKIVSDEIVDGKENEQELYSCMTRALLVILICGIFIMMIYEGVKHRYK